MRSIAALLVCFIPLVFCARESLSEPTGEMFAPDDRRLTLHPSLFFDIHVERCPRRSEELKAVFQNLGNWDVDDVISTSDSTFLVFLSSHEDIEPFYTQGYWWAAKLEIEFYERYGSYACKRFRVNVFEAVICYGPSDNPRKDCQDNRGLPIDSKAAANFQTRVGGRLREALGELEVRKLDNRL
jgi:hypothetical protein